MADLSLSVGGPATAVLDYLTSMNNFLSTPVGQKLLDANLDLFAKIYGKIHDRITAAQANGK